MEGKTSGRRKNDQLIRASVCDQMELKSFKLTSNHYTNLEKKTVLKEVVAVQRKKKHGG